MPARKEKPEVIDLLAGERPAVADPEIVTTESVIPPVEQKTITLEQPLPAPAPVRPKPENELTPEQKQIRDLQDQLAKERGNKDPDLEFEPAVENGENILIHFVADGLTALGTIWRIGQELEFTHGSPAYQDTCDRFGRSWLDLRNDEQAQIARWGEVKFRVGPWPGKSYVDSLKERWDSFEPLKPGQKLTPAEEELVAAQKAEALRRRAAPRLPLR